MNLYIPQLHFILQLRCNPSKRENRQNGNQESSQEGTREESREESREEEVTGTPTSRQQVGNIEGDAKSVPLNVCAKEYTGMRERCMNSGYDTSTLDCRTLG
jgi:hypothetical protein